MRNFFLLIMVGLIGFGGWNAWKHFQQSKSEPAAPIVESAPPQIAPIVEKKPTPSPNSGAMSQGAKAPSPTPVAVTAQPGIFFLVQPVSITTDSGIRGVVAGTQVKLISENGNAVRVTDGRQEFDVRRDFLTNDLMVVKKIAEAHTAARAQAEKRKQDIAASQMAAAEAQKALVAEQTRMGAENIAAANAALQEKKEQIAEIRRKIAAAVDAKSRQPPSYWTQSRQQWIISKEKEIVEFQRELSRIGVAGATLDQGAK